ncbi:hypothetical protein BDF22DRAFT_742197 [Syncephalis plumigaleata]|nr:hypothetical protein BDF22DRAFT_742197 [Syncephalis plumigaleata]
MNIISTTAVAALLLASIESAESVDPSNMPKTYLNYPMGVKGAFKQPRLELSTIIEKNDIVDYIEGMWDGKPATITCLDPSKPEGKIVHSVYERHILAISSGSSRPPVRKGAKYFGNVVATPSESGKQCYVIDNACKYTYEQHVKNLSEKLVKKRASFDKTIMQIVAAVKYVQTKGLLYDFSSESKQFPTDSVYINLTWPLTIDMCFDANESLLMLRHNIVLPIEQTIPRQRSQVNTNIQNAILNLEGAVNGQVNSEAINDKVKRITQPILYPESPSSSPSGSRRNSISGTSLPPQ